MKSRFFIVPALCLALVFGCDSDRRTAQGDGYENTETEEGMNSDRGYGVDTERTSASGMEEDTRESVTDVASSSMLEVEMGRMAQEKAQSQEVREFSQMLVQEHQNANQELMNIAQQNNIELPQQLKDDHQSKIEDLTEKEGQEFDQEYMDIVVNRHEEDIDKLESLRENVQDADLRQWIDNNLTNMRQHLEQAEQIKDRLDNNNDSNGLL